VSDTTNSATTGWKQLDTARLCLALLVVAAHANYIFITPLGYTASFPITEWMARYAVLGFFVLSGLVIGRSLVQRRDGFVPFLIRRIGRIYPPLILSFVLLIAIDHVLRAAGIPTRTLPNAGPMTSSYSYDPPSAALCLATFGFRGWLASEANGALWSLVIEMRCYVVAGLLAQVAFSRSRAGKIGWSAALLGAVGLLARDPRLDPLITICYAAFAFGLLLNLAVKRIPPVLPVVRLDISYSLYIVHAPVMLGLFFASYQPAFPSLAGALALSAAAILAALALSIFSARFVEPFRGQALAAAWKNALASRGSPAKPLPAGNSSF